MIFRKERIIIFTPADFLIPHDIDISRWAVIACDQFTSEPEYWRKVQEYAAGFPSSYNLILPEVFLKDATPEKISQINSVMNEYIASNIFREYANSFVYVERKLLSGKIRRGIVGVIDLEEYDFKEGATSPIRATEATVSERIPPRVEVRENAILELSHVILLCDDDKREIIEPLSLSKFDMPKLYDFSLMMDGGKIQGWQVRGEHARALNMRIQSYIKRKRKEQSVIFAVGDGNHSLAAAKTCYEMGKTSRYAMVELENIHDEALNFEPIHRIIKNVEPDEIISDMQKNICSKNGYELRYYHGENSGVLYLDKNLGASALIVLQNYLDGKNFEIDYIHDTEALQKLSQENNCVGFELGKFEKNNFFRVISENGALPRKTFSMGHAVEKRYYLEARRIK